MSSLYIEFINNCFSGPKQASAGSSIDARESFVWGAMKILNYKMVHILLCATNYDKIYYTFYLLYY